MSSQKSSKPSKRTVDFLSLEGRVSLVTGGSRGIGAATALELAKAGSAVALFDLNAGEAEAAARSIAEATGLEARGYAGDVTDRPRLRAIVQQIVADFGGIDHLINNAGVQFVNAIESFPDEKWDLVRAVDLDGVFNATKAVWPHLVRRGRGRIVNIASVQGLVASEFKAAYVAAKHGVIGLTGVSALEGAAHGITANAVCPGAVLTELVKGQVADLMRSFGAGTTEQEAMERGFLAKMPTKRLIMPEEVGQLCAYLCTDAARSITGAAIPIDGGWTTH